jgi:quercetin 2,3-dioxygenase
MGRSDLGWLRSIFHFSFAEYNNPANVQFGALRVLNDDLIAPHTGFDTHPHRDMEIISYVVHGQLTHRDSMGNASVLERGHVQYMSAGTGVLHSEHNQGDAELRLLQLWILPDRKNHVPRYGEHRFPWEIRQQKWLHLVSGATGSAPITVHQDVNIYAVELDAGASVGYPLAADRQAYLVQIEGAALVNGLRLQERDALECSEEDLLLTATSRAHFLLVEMAKLTGL